MTDPERAAGIDHLIGEAREIGHGLGPVMIRRFLPEIWTRYPDIEKVITTTDATNRRSWRALEKCGFRRVFEGEIASDDPSDKGPSTVYVLVRSELT